jgi:hypothetical protein
MGDGRWEASAFLLDLNIFASFQHLLEKIACEKLRLRGGPLGATCKRWCRHRLLLVLISMLLRDGKIIKADALLEHPALRQTSETFLAESSEVPGGSTVLYACQSEIVDVDLRDQPAYSGVAAPPAEAPAPASLPSAILCSSDATTCVIVAIVAGVEDGSAVHTVARIAHHDEGTTGSPVALQQTVAGLAPAADRHTPAAKLWLAGAYADAGGVGARVLHRLLGFLQRCKAALEVQLCCVGRWNTSSGGAPLCTALALDLRTLQARPAAPAAATRGPLLPARCAQWCYSTTCSDGQAGPLRCLRWRPIERPPTLRLALRQGRPPEQLAAHAAFLLALDDEQLLGSWSTSPQHEPPHFVTGEPLPCPRGDAAAAALWRQRQRCQLSLQSRQGCL